MARSPQGSFQSITPSWSVSSVVWLCVEHGLKEWHVWWDSVSCVSPQSWADVEGCSASDRQDCKDPQPHGARVESQRRGIPRSPQVPSTNPRRHATLDVWSSRRPKRRRLKARVVRLSYLWAVVNLLLRVATLKTEPALLFFSTFFKVWCV